jgi:CRISPR-associated protein Csb2
MVGRYVRESQVWSSVTPVVLPGLDDGKQAKAEGLFLKAAAQVRIPIEAIESVTLRKAPFWRGAIHPRHYFVPAYLRSFARWHVTVCFREPVPGPLAIGAGRHVGLGILAVVDDAAEPLAANGARRRR